MVLLVVDTQDRIMTEELYLFHRFIQNVSKLISTAREKNSEVIYIRHDDGVELTSDAEGFEICNLFAPNDHKKIFDKNCNSAFTAFSQKNYTPSPANAALCYVAKSCNPPRIAALLRLAQNCICSALVSHFFGQTL